jgi:hypothetical protein
MHQAGRPARRAAGEIPGLEQRDAKAPQGGIPRDAGPGDPAADDGDVERLEPQSPADELAPGSAVRHGDATWRAFP